VTLVGNDTGGALCQMLVTSRPERIGRLVLTSCDYRDKFPPPPFDSAIRLLPRFESLLPILFAPTRVRALRRLPFVMGGLTTRPIERRVEDSYALPVLADRGVRADFLKMVRGVDARLTNEAADRLRDFDRPALIAWSREGLFFKPEDAVGLASDLPNARLEWIEDARTFSAEDQPDRLAELIAGFVREPAGTAA
jgi:pimeloyl-ACP methyl ester carboxylesterase